MSIAITGATGHLGRLVIDRLKTKVPASQIIALVRSPEKAKDLDVTAREFDYTRPQTLAPALAGVEKLLLISSSEIGQREPQHRNVIAAAKASDIKHFVYTSLLHADRSPISVAGEHHATEANIAASGIPATILRNGWYAENYTVSIPAALANGAFIGCAAEGEISLATRADYADAAVTVLTNAGHQGKTYELAGDKAYTLSDLAAEISRQTGRNIPYRNLPQAEYAAILKRVGLPDVRAEFIASSDFDASHGALFDDGHQLSKLIGRATTPLSEAVRRALA